MTDEAAEASSPPPDYGEILKRLRNGTIVPFFGAGASIGCGLPSGKELAQRLASRGKFPDKDESGNLALVASYLVEAEDTLTLYEELRTALGITAEPGRIHRCLAGFDELRLYVTTNYDNLVEKALEPRSPWVVVDHGTPGVVWCRPPGGSWKEVEAKTLGAEIQDQKRPIVLKLHGSFDREDRDNDSYLITEEHYVDFLGRAEGAQIPSMLANRMRERSFLFLGYGLKDWNVRVLLRKLASTRPRSGKINSWAIVRNPGRAERELWKAQNVEMHGVTLDDFAAGLEAASKAPG